MPEASVADVMEVISTSLSDPEITDSIEVAAELNAEYHDVANQTTTQTKNIERWAAVVNIRQFKEPAVEAESIGRASSDYEGSELQRAKTQLAQWIRRAGGDTDMASTVIRDSSRHVTSTDL